MEKYIKNAIKLIAVLACLYGFFCFVHTSVEMLFIASLSMIITATFDDYIHND